MRNQLQKVLVNHFFQDTQPDTSIVLYKACEPFDVKQGAVLDLFNWLLN